MSGARGPDRLSPQDVSNLRVEDRGLPMHVAALAVLEGAPLRDSEGLLRLDAMRAEIERRLHLAPRLRQVVYRPPLGLGPPIWVDDPGFDIGEHVRARAIPPPGDEAALLATCLELNEPALARSRPPWQLWFLTGLSGGDVGMLIRLHHVIADGIGTVALFGSLFEFDPSAPGPTAPPWILAPLPSSWELLADNVRSRRTALATVISGLAHPAKWLRHLKATAPSLRELIAEGLAPRSSLNVPVGKHRLLLLARGNLDRAKAVAREHGGKVNDVLLAAVAGGARQLLRSRGELARRLVLRASVPVSVRGSEDPRAAGNLGRVMMVPLSVGEPDPIRRLEKIALATAERKRRPRLAMGWDPGSSLAQRAMVRVMNRQRLVNLFTSNVPGPPTPMYFAGARVLEVFQVGVVQGNVTLSVGVLSYAGQLNFDIVGDADACPDLAVFAEGLRRTLEELGVAPKVSATLGELPQRGT